MAVNLKTCEMAVEEYNKTHKEQLTKEVTIPTLSYKVTQSDDGEIIDSDSWQESTVTMKIYPEARLNGSFLLLKQSRQVDRGFMWIIFRFQFLDGSHGFSVSEIDIGSANAEGVDVSISKAKKITAEEAAKIINAKTHWLRQREGTQLRMPSIANFKIAA